MKRHIFLIVTALFCFMPQAKTHAPVPAEALGLVCCYSSAVFLAFSLQELDDYLKSVYYRNEKYQLYESSKKTPFRFCSSVNCFFCGIKHMLSKYI